MLSLAPKKYPSRLVDMLESEDEHSQRSSRANRSGRSGETRHLLLQRDRRGLFDYDDEPPLQHLHLNPRVSEDLEDVYAAVQDDGWEPWPEEKGEDSSDVRVFFFRVSLFVGLCSSHLSTRRKTCSTESPQAHPYLVALDNLMSSCGTIICESLKYLPSFYFVFVEIVCRLS